MTIQMDTYQHWDRQIETCLLVDDDALDRTAIRRAIERQRPDAQVIEFGTLKDARSYLDRAHADIVLLDNRLPDGFGSELATELQRRPEMRDTPIFVITNDAVADLDHSVIALSKDDLTPQSLAALMSEFLKARRLASLASPEALAADLLPEGDAGIAPAISRVIRLIRLSRAQISRSAPLATIKALESAEDLLLAVSHFHAPDTRH